MTEILVVKEDIVRELVPMEKAIKIVEEAFSDFYLKHSTVFPAVREKIEEADGIFGIKSANLIAGETIGLKAGGFWKNNTKIGKTNHQSTMLLFNTKTGEPVCLMDANYLTGIRTGAAGAVAAKYLARKDSHVLGLISAGVQSRTQMEGILLQFPIQRVIVYDRNINAAQQFCNEIKEKGFEADFADSPRQVAEIADILVTSTPSFEPVIKTSWVKKGVHINAIGSDTSGKRELEIDNVPDKLVCDYWEQSSIMGEYQHGISRKQIYAEIGELTAGEKSGRENDQEITLFDATGIAVQDLAVAAFVYQKAKETQKGQLVEL